MDVLAVFKRLYRIIRYESDDVIWLRNHASTWILVPNIGCKQIMASNTGGPLTFFFFFFFFWCLHIFLSDYPKAIRRGEISFKSNYVIERNFEAANSRITGTSSGQLYKPCLRVRAFFHKTVWVCQVNCNFKISFTCRITVIFRTLKNGSLLTNTLASNICFSYRNMFQNGVDALSKIVDAFLSKSSKFYLVWIILWHKHLLRNYKCHFRLLMSEFATAVWNTLSKHQLFTLNFAFKLFHVSITIDNCRSQKYHL